MMTDLCQISTPNVNVPSITSLQNTWKKASFLLQITNLTVIVVPLLAVIAAPFCVWGWGFSYTDLALLVGMYLITGLGITVGFHRHFCHKSFETYTWVKFLMAVAGSMALQGSIVRWVGMHRRHHQLSDTHDDPHTPHHQADTFIGMIRGFIYAHFGWIFSPQPPDMNRYVKDILGNKTLRVFSALFPLWALGGLLVAGLIGGLISMSWSGFLTGFIWGGLVRVFLVHHVTWSVNSACHLWGSRPFKSDDMSRNNFIFGVLALGEGWHNTHHAFPSSARHGLRWWQIDLSWIVISTLKFFRLAWSVRVPSIEAQNRLANQPS